MNYDFNLRVTVDCTDRLEKVLMALVSGTVDAGKETTSGTLLGVLGTHAEPELLSAPQAPAPKKAKRTATKKDESPAEETVKTEMGDKATDWVPAPADDTHDTHEMPAEGTTSEKEIKMEDLRPAMAKLWSSGNKERTAQILQKHGAKLLKEVKPEEYKTLLNEFNEALYATA